MTSNLKHRWSWRRAILVVLALSGYVCSRAAHADSVVVFNELMYHPAENEAALEWIELRNQMSVDIDLSGWTISNGVNYVFPNGTIAPGRGYVVIASDPATLAAQTGLSGILGPFDGRLANSGETLVLRDNSGRIMSELTYGDAGDWPVAADGSGASLAMCDEDGVRSDPEAWGASITVGGTPGASNRAARTPWLVSFNEIAPAGTTNFWIELANCSAAPVQLAGTRIWASGTTIVCVLPAQMLAPGALHVLDAAALGFVPRPGDKLFLAHSNAVMILDGQLASTRLVGRHPDGTGAWRFPAAATPGATNVFAFASSVVINELMYHHRPVYARPAEYRVYAHVLMTSTWKYSQSGNLGTAWRAPSYDDSAWPSGQGLFYFGTSLLPGPKNTLLTMGRTTYYFRTTFTFTNAVADTWMNIQHIVDDGVVVYLNGSEIHRFNMPSGTIGYGTYASSSIVSGQYSGQFSFPLTNLVNGVNVLAAEVHQNLAGFTDFAFGLELFSQVCLSTGAPATDVDQEWVELHNPTTATVDLSNWAFDEGITYTFPPGTLLTGGEYLVVARNAAALQALHPAARIIGNFSGRLANSGERLVLRDAFGNPADSVRYYDARPWPDYADGAGSSLELMDPRADNNNAAAWAASDESSRNGWFTYTYRNVADNALRPEEFQEFVLGLLEAGECLLDDVRVIENPATAPRDVLRNGNFESGSNHWRFLGTHARSAVIADPDTPGNHVLHVIATGPTDYMHNHIEATLSNGVVVSAGVEYEISFRAKWLAGAPLVHTRLYFNRVPRTTVLQQHALSGTPGAPNSRRIANLGPTFTGFSHTPVIPNPGQPVSVRVQATDPDGVQACRLWWSVQEGAWQSALMTASNAMYVGTIPGQSAGQIVQFYVQAVDGANATSFYPTAGAASRALYVVQDNQASLKPVHHVRLIMLTSEVARLHANPNVMNNALEGGTVVYNEKRAFYDVGIRLKGVSTRQGIYTGYTVKFPADDLFRGFHDSIGLDRGGRLQGTTYGMTHSVEEALVKQMMNRAGNIPCQYDDIVRCIAPRADYTSSALLMMGRYQGEYFDSLWPNGSDGPLHKFELIYYSSTTVDGNPESIKIAPDKNLQRRLLIDVHDLGNDPEYYRWHFLMSNRQQYDDYRGVIGLCKLFSMTGSVLDVMAPRVIDEDQWMRLFASHALNCIFDTYNFGGHHNMLFYQRPTDGRMLALPIDMDWAYEPNIWIRGTNAPLVGSNYGDTYNLGKIIMLPRNLRRLYSHVLDLIDTSFNTNYLTRWANHFYSLVDDQPASFAGDLAFIHDRRACALRQIPAQAPFRITTNNGQPFATSNLTAQLAGTAGFTVHHLRQAGSAAPLNATWSSLSNWQAEVSLVPGTNNVILFGMNPRGMPVASNSIVIICTAAAPGLPPILINEFMASNTGSVRDEYGNTPDWVELYNPSLMPWPLSNLYLTDRATTLTEYALPSTAMIAPTGFVVVWADGATNLGVWHALFKLSKSGEQLFLSYIDGASTTVLHYLPFGPQQDDISYGWYPDGATNSGTFMPPTPGAVNIIPEPAVCCVVLLGMWAWRQL